jgi:large subunit ribosomal protein L31
LTDLAAPCGRLLQYRIVLRFPWSDAGGGLKRLKPRSIVKKDIHPNYQEATVVCGCGNRFTTRSTRKQITVEICSACHPFFTGKMKFVDTTGRVERFQNKYKNSAYAAKRKADAAADAK